MPDPVFKVVARAGEDGVVCPRCAVPEPWEIDAAGHRYRYSKVHPDCPLCLGEGTVSPEDAAVWVLRHKIGEASCA